MAKKQPSIVNELQSKIEIAQAAVDTMTDESLKPIAFQVVLDRLLSSGELSIPEISPTQEPNKPPNQEKLKIKQPKGPKGRIEALIEDGFFAHQRTIGDVKDALAARGWFHRVEDINPTLLRLLQEKKLRRIKEPEKDGGKLVWRYSNW